MYSRMSGNGSLDYYGTNSTMDALSSLPVSRVATYEPPFGETGVIFSAIIIFTMLVVGAIANTLTILVIMTYRELNQNVFMRFILSLCASDLISALISWLFLYRRTWGFDDFRPMPNFLCKLYWAGDIMASYVTALHIFSFALLRFISIKYPLLYKKIRIPQGNLWMGLIWLVCFCAAFIPGFLIFGSAPRDRYSDSSAFGRWPSCTARKDRHTEYLLFQKIGYPIFFYGPTLGVVVACTAVVILVASRSRSVATSSRDKRRRLKEKKAVIQLLLIIVSFLMGYVPFTAYEFWSSENHENTQYNRKVDYWFGMVGYFFLRFSECLNPFFYNLGFPKVYEHTKLFISTKLFCGYKVLRWPSLVSGSTDMKISTLSSEGTDFQRTKV